jgi:hypothetical protein
MLKDSIKSLRFFIIFNIRHLKVTRHWNLVLGGFLAQLSFRINTLGLGPKKAFIIEAGPVGFEPTTAGFLSISLVKSPVLYLAELRAHYLSL